MKYSLYICNELFLFSNTSVYSEIYLQQQNKNLAIGSATSARTLYIEIYTEDIVKHGHGYTIFTYITR